MDELLLKRNTYFGDSLMETDNSWPILVYELNTNLTVDCVTAKLTIDDKTTLTWLWLDTEIDILIHHSPIEAFQGQWK